MPTSQAARSILLEVCVDSVESALAAQVGEADRVEICDNLLEGGTTPSAGTIELARERLAIGLQVIIRPRGGDFCYSDTELEVMRRDIVRARSIGADGVVIGILTPDGTVDVEHTAGLIALARPLNVTFHRAFDMVRDPLQALDDLIALGVDRVLTSGQAPSALAGLPLIAALVRHAGDRIVIMPGGGVAHDLAAILGGCDVRELHMSARSPVDSIMRWRNDRVHMGGTQQSEYTRLVTDSRRIRELRRIADEYTSA